MPYAPARPAAPAAEPGPARRLDRPGPPDPSGVSPDNAASDPVDGDADGVAVADPDALRSIGSPGAAAAPFAVQDPSPERRPAAGVPRLPTAPTACRCSADTTSVACRGHSSVCRTGSTLGSLAPLSPASGWYPHLIAELCIVAGADHWRRSPPRAGGTPTSSRSSASSPARIMRSD